MNNRTIFSILILFISFITHAQFGRMKEKNEQIKALKVAFITTELKLTPSEAEKFWPIYTVFDDRQFELRHLNKKKALSKMGDDDLEDMTEKEANTFLIQMENNEEELFLLRKKFITSLKAILPSTKIIKLRKCEDDFNRILLQQYRDKGPRR